MPQIRSFRALRYAADAGDIAQLVAPPYDVISADQRARFLDRHPRNVVRLDLPIEEPFDEPDDRYRRTARTLAAWRSDGTFRKEPKPALYPYEQTYRVPGTDTWRTTRGFFGRLKLEPLAPGSGVLPHERTMALPREDRYKLLRATGVNTSPTVGLFADRTRAAADCLAQIAAQPMDTELTDEDGVQHRLWVVPDDGDPDGTAARLMLAAGASPITIADGHHRYETALRYRDERRMARSCEEDPAFDYVLMLFLGIDQPLTVLPTHRVVRGLGEEGVSDLLERAGELFDVRSDLSPENLRTAFGTGLDGAAGSSGGAGRIGLWSRRGGALLTARRESFAPFLPAGGGALRRLDVTLLGLALERLCGIDQGALVAGERIAYTKSVDEALAWVDGGIDRADAAFLLEPTPVADIVAVAADGDVMPQKSTYFYPKALTGLVINPHEW